VALAPPFDCMTVFSSVVVRLRRPAAPGLLVAQLVSGGMELRHEVRLGDRTPH
jgi:hypothetical protein